jgi:hypothetical protein
MGYLLFALFLAAMPVYGDEEIISFEVRSGYADGGRIAYEADCPRDSQYEVDLSGQRTVRVLVDMENMGNSAVSFYVGLLRPNIIPNPWKPRKKEEGFYVLRDPGERQILDIYGTVPESESFSLLELKKDGSPLVSLRGTTKAHSNPKESLESQPSEQMPKNTILPQLAIQYYTREFERARLVANHDLARKQIDALFKEFTQEETKARTAHLKVKELEGELKSIGEKETNNANIAEHKLEQAKEAYNLRLYDEPNFEGDALDYAQSGLRILRPSWVTRLKKPFFYLFFPVVVIAAIAGIVKRRGRQNGI